MMNHLLRSCLFSCGIVAGMAIAAGAPLLVIILTFCAGGAIAGVLAAQERT
jgi:hypothetical protein